MRIGVILSITIAAFVLAGYSIAYSGVQKNLKDNECYQLKNYYNPWTTGETRSCNVENDCDYSLQFTVVGMSGLTHTTSCIPKNFQDYSGFRLSSDIKSVTPIRC